MKRAVNPQTGEVVFLFNDQWVSPSQVAVNEAGDKAFLVNNQWIVPPPPAPTPEPIVTPDEQMASSTGDATGTNYTLGNKLLDTGKMITAGLTSGTASIPLGLESGVRNIPRQALEQQQVEPRKIGALTFAEEIAKKGAPQLFANLGRSILKSATGQTVEEQQKRQKEDEVVLDRAISKLPRIPGFSELAESGKRGSQYLTESLSEEGKLALENSQIQGNILKSIQEGTIDNLSFGKDPSFMGYALQGSQVLGSIVPVIATALMTRNTRFETSAPTAVGFGQGAGEAVEKAKEHVKNMSDEQLAIASPYFKHMIENGVNPKEARQVVSDKAAEYAAQLQGAVSAFGGNITAKLVTGKFDKLLTTTVKNKLSQIALGGAAGMTEEGLQEFLEGVASDLAIDKTVVKEIGAESFANFIMGSIGGVVPGAYRGAVAKREEAVSAQPEVAPTVTPVTPETPPSDAAAAAVPPVPQAPVSGAIGETELETAEDRAAPTAATNEVMMPIVDVDGNVTDKMDKIDLNNVFVEDGAIWVAGEDYDHDLNSVLEELTDETQKAELIKRAEALQPKTTETLKEEEVKGAKTTELPKRSSAQNIPTLDVDAVLDSSDPEVINNVREILKDYKVESGQSVEGNYLQAVNKDLMDKEETLNSPPISAKSVIPSASIQVVPFDGGFLSSSSYSGKTNGYASPISVFGTKYATRQEAIDAEANVIRRLAQEDKNNIALKWVDSLSKPTKETKAEINRKRQAEKKAKAVEEQEEDVSEIEEGAEEETEAASYQLEKDPSATKIESPDGRVKIFLRQITEADPKNYEGKSLAGKWLSETIYKTPDGASYGPGKTPKSSPITSDSRDEALKSAIEYIQFLNEKAEKKGKSDTKAMQFLDELAAKNDITLETPAEKKAAANRKRQEEKKAATQQEKETGPDDLEYATKIIEFREGKKTKDLVKKFGQAFIDQAEKDGDIRSYTSGKEKSYTTDTQGEDKFYNATKTDDGKYTLKQIHEAYDSALQDVGHANILKTYEFLERNPEGMLQSALDSGLVRINDAGTIWPAYRLSDITAKQDREKVDIVELSKEHKREDEQFQAKARKEYDEKIGKELKKYEKEREKVLEAARKATKDVPTKEEKSEANRKRQAEKKKATTDLNEEKLVDAIRDMAYNKGFDINKTNTADDFIAKYGKKMFDAAVEQDLLDNEPGAGRLFPSNKFVYEVLKKYYDEDNKKIGKAKEAKPKAEVKESGFSVKLDGRNIPVTINKTDERNGEKLVNINVNSFDNRFKQSTEFYIGKEGKGGIGQRYKTFAEFQKTAESIEAPEVYVNENGGITFGNGRHRYAYMRDQGLKTIPVAMSQESIDNAKKFGFVEGKAPKAEEKHIEGNKSEPVTADTIENAIDKADKKVNKTTIKKSINEQFEKAIKETKYLDNKAWAKSKGDADSFVTIEIPGDGKFRVKNNAERLKELQKRLLAALPLKTGKPSRKPSAASVSDPEKVLAEMINDNDIENALEYARLKKIVPTRAGLTPQGIENIEKAFSTEKEFLKFKAEIEGTPIDEVETYEESMARITAKMEEEGRESEYEKAAKELAATKAKIAELQGKPKAERAKTMTEEEIFGEQEKVSPAPGMTQKEINKARQQAKKDAAVSKDKGTFYENFTGELSESDKKAMRQEIREEKIIQKGVISRKISTIVKKIASVGGDLETQKRLNYLTSKRADLNNYIVATKPERRSADWFRARAAEELALGNLMPETMAVIDELYKKYPSFLEGLKLSVRAGKRVGVEGSFEPIERLVSIFKNPFSVTQDETMRHEIMHSLEQMMTPEAQIALVNAWADALSKAMKRHTDERSQLFFNAVLDYIENPTRDNYRKATNKLPDLSFYQYMNPSEFWAVNGEKLMKAQLGNSWARFVKGVQKILEALKNVFGFDNRYAVHREFDRLMKAEAGQMTDTMLADYLKQNDVEIEFLNQVEDVDELLNRHDRPDTPLNPSDSVKQTMLDKVEDFKGYRQRLRENPKLEASKMVGSVDRAITYARNKNVWFGTGLELADLKKYMGKLRDSNGFAIASIALTNALHAGHVATQVITQGALRFDPVLQKFTAYASKYSLANIVREKAKLVKQLGEQRATNLINSFFEAKRSRSIQNEFYNRQAEYETLKQKFEAAVETEEKDQLYKDMVESREALEKVSVAMDKVNMTDEAIDDFIAMEKKFPELREMMKNWTAVNRNMIDNMEFSGIISKKRAAQLREIEDYVPWYRIQDEMADPHDPVSSGVRGLTNVGKEKKFKKGTTDKDIDDIVDNMIHNVMMTTRNSIRNYAANRIAMEYATRNDKGKIKVFPKEGVMADGAVRANILANGRRIVIEIKDPLIAESVIGMESIEIPMYNVLGMMANGLRRGITTFPIFQIKQLFMDAPTAAWVSGVKNPFAVWSKTFASFAAALNPNDPIVNLMKSAGVGGYQSSARTPEKELKLQIGLIGRSPFAGLMKILDHIGDASDYAQRRAIYKQVLSETRSAEFPGGDQMQALIQANNVIDFLKHGSARHAQFLTRTVSFMNAYAQSVDVLAQSMAGGGLKGKERSQVFAQFVKTGAILSVLSLLYAFAIGDDEEYQKMDDQTKVRNFIIPKSWTKVVGMENSVKVPMHTSASFFFKSMPELLYNKIMNEGTKNHVDNQRLRTALREAAVDALLGPNVTPTGVKPFIEIALNRNFFTGSTLTPKGMENLETFRQYTANTSELGKVISKGTLGVLNPIEADHLMKSLLGTVGASVMWGSNLFSGDRVEPNASANPLYGAFVSAPVPRGPEDIYYDLKERSTKVYNTYIDLMKKGRTEEGRKYRSENEALFKAYGYTNGVEQGLKKVNAEIRRIGDLPGDKLTGAEKRERITFYQNKKNEILKDVIEYRKKAGL